MEAIKQTIQKHRKTLLIVKFLFVLKYTDRLHTCLTDAVNGTE